MLGSSYSFLVAKSLALISIEELLLSVSVVVEAGRKGKEIGARKNHLNFVLQDIKFLYNEWIRSFYYN